MMAAAKIPKRPQLVQSQNGLQLKTTIPKLGPANRAPDQVNPKKPK
jgi:hypothetical protein